jgi:hypothetical protein
MNRMRRFSIAVAVGAAALLPAALVPLEADDPVGTSITFNREIIRIVQRKCEPCHAQGGLAMSLSDFRDARAWGRAIREELVEHRMPPAILARGYGEYETDPSLNAREMATFLTWLDGGMPRGDEADLPARPARADIPAEPEGPGSVRVALPLQTVPARENLVVRRVMVDAGAAAGLTVARVQLRPGNPRVLRGALVFAAASAGVASPGATPGALIGAWVPWQHAIVPPSAYGFELPAQASLVADLYYRGADTPQTDHSAVELIVSRDRVVQPVRDVAIEPSEQNSTGFRGQLHLRDSASVWAIHPTLDASVASFELRAERPDHSVEVLLWVPTVRPEWPLALVTREPVALPAGSIISFVAARNQSRSGTPPRVILSLMR